MAPTLTTPLQGMSYYHPRPGSTVTAREGFLTISIDDVPIPLLDDDFARLPEMGLPDYDMVGRGLYEALRRNPDILHARRYASILREGYPHYLAELGSLVIMLDRKDVDPAYLDRKISYLKIFRLIEPANHRFPYEIGLTYFRKGTSLDACRDISYSLFKAEEFLHEAWLIDPDDREVRALLAEVSFILGRYGRAVELWEGLMHLLDEVEARKASRMIGRIRETRTPFVPVVDYLEAVAVAFGHAQRQEYEEAVSILCEVLGDDGFREGYPFPELWFVLGSCHESLSSPDAARACYREALSLRPGYAEATEALERLECR